MARYLKMILKGTRCAYTATNASIPLFLVAACQTGDGEHNSSTKREPIKFLDARELSHEALIRQTCVLAANSSSQMITQVLIAITDTSRDYREAMSRLMSLLEDSIILISNSISPLQNEIEDLVVKQRSAVDEQRRAVVELVSLMQHVEKMVTSTAETAFLAGAEQSSTLMCERLNSALEKVVLECATNKEVEEELLRLQQAYVMKLGDASKNLHHEMENMDALPQMKSQEKNKDNKIQNF